MCIWVAGYLQNSWMPALGANLDLHEEPQVHLSLVQLEPARFLSH